MMSAASSPADDATAARASTTAINRLLAEIFYGQPAPGAELARRTGIPQQTVARELARLEHGGLFTTDRIGTAKVAAPAPDLPYIDALRQLLGYAGGIIPALIDAYEANPAIAEVFNFRKSP